MGAPIVHFEIMGPDSQKLRDYYSKLFGWEYQDMPQMDYGLLKAPADKSGIGNGMPGQAPYVTIYASVEDVEAALKKAISLGGTEVMPVTTIPGMVRFAMFKDPAGNIMGLVWNQMPAA